MLQGRLSVPAAIALVAVAGCSDQPIEENVVEPGITAIEQAGELACNQDAAALRTALDTYEMLEGEPAPDEAALVDAEYLREESELWDVDDGALVPTDPGCGDVPGDTGSATDDGSDDEIVTSVEPPDLEQLLADLSADEIAAVGGEACARELLAIFAAGERYVAERDGEPDDFDDLIDAGYLDGPVELWIVVDDQLAPAPDSGCRDPSE